MAFYKCFLFEQNKFTNYVNNIEMNHTMIINEQLDNRKIGEIAQL